jgi:S-formylglutathione hydrolase FrmB
MSEAFRCCRLRPSLLLRAVPLVLAFTSILASSGLAAGRVECGTVQSKLMRRPVRYCALLPAGYDADRSKLFPVVYYLHGLGDNEQSLVNSGGWYLVEELQEKRRIAEFVIVTPDAGRSFYINSKSGNSPYEDFFFREFLPAIEGKYRIRAARQSRALLGISMGGYGALRFAFLRPDLFAAAAAHMPALIEKLPRGITDARSLGPRFGFLNEIFGPPFDAALWERNSPFTLARRLSAGSAPRIYLDCGRSDEYGFDAGTEAMGKLLLSLKLPVEWHIHPGGHSWFYVAEHIPASLQFLSAVLEPGRGRTGANPKK